MSPGFVSSFVRPSRLGLVPCPLPFHSEAAGVEAVTSKFGRVSSEYFVLSLIARCCRRCLGGSAHYRRRRYDRR